MHRAKEREKHRNNTVPQPHARNTPVSSTDHSFCLTAVHLTPFSTSVFPDASPVYQQCSRIRSCGSNITKDNNTRRKTKGMRAHQHDSVPPTVHSHQGQIHKSEHKPWDEIDVSSHYIDDVQLTDCVTDEFRFQHPSSRRSTAQGGTSQESDPSLPVPHTIYISKSLVRNPPIALSAVAYRTSVTRFQVYTLSDVQICFVHHVVSIV